ncbi:MAG: hypothetical protein DWQ31_07130 [Planctomycetota bacterium]|nr:MAG: hypothetical protein DWQ31_07130 [Planctomycetota bacterium]REJ89567.1 MAG: hypothetical protein DWQ35_17925 [Planctomycetota bacterium]REK31430.1 MAG: hypothetical protein DWQ42_00435 [Planctomycetota bacterium]REK40660.1 MAG: hypothetical protein DWQ46_15575 [Planctomycetota bacterium]
MVAAAWLASTYVFWMGYAGTDDIFYARYANSLHRLPLNHWEYRLPAVYLMRLSIFLFGPTEFAAALPTLLSSLAMLASVAWLIDWPRRPTWQANCGMLLFCFMPLDISFRSYPNASYIAAGMLAVGSVAMLKGSRLVQYLGAGLMAVAFLTHEVSFFYVAIFCLTALAFDRRRYWYPVIACVAFSGGLFAIEAAIYYSITGEAFARYTRASAAIGVLEAGRDVRVGASPLSFFLWPLKNVLFCKQLAFSLLLLFGSGLLVFGKLRKEQKILLAVMILFWAYLGYGSLVPWTYKPLGRAWHYYYLLVVGIAALLPYTLTLALGERERLSRAILLFTLVALVGCAAAGGRWGQNVDVSRELLAYAQAHPEKTFLTDVNTMNQMYVWGGFQLPENVICLNGEPVEKHLLINKEPEDTPRYEFPRQEYDAVLLNLEGFVERKPFANFQEVRQSLTGEREVIVPPRYRLVFLPWLLVAEPRDFMIRSRGGAVVHLDPTD